MWPLWWWPQEFMQPLMCRSMSPMSTCSSRSAKRSVICAASGIERALARPQKSPPGQAIRSVMKPMLGVAKPAALAACQSANNSLSRTQGSSRFCSCVTRNSPWLNRSAMAAACSICTSVASPGAWPARLSDSVTAR